MPDTEKESKDSPFWVGMRQRHPDMMQRLDSMVLRHALEEELQTLHTRIEQVTRQRNSLAGRASHGGFCPAPVGLPCSCGLNATLLEIAQEKEASDE